RASARLSYEGMIEWADRTISAEGLPDPLRECQDATREALAEAGIRASAQRKVLAHQLALYTALDQASPATARERRNSLQSFDRASKRILELADDVEPMLCDAREVDPTPEGDPVWELHDPMAKIRCSLEAGLAGIQRGLKSHGASGRRISSTT